MVPPTWDRGLGQFRLLHCLSQWETSLSALKRPRVGGQLTWMLNDSKARESSPNLSLKLGSLIMIQGGHKHSILGVIILILKPLWGNRNAHDTVDSLWTDSVLLVELNLELVLLYTAVMDSISWSLLPHVWLQLWWKSCCGKQPLELCLQVVWDETFV